ncbi:MAG: PAS domain-containing protein [Syntrophorhabdaceae bacterium]|nr:PAS domain-containing protein [Syntrophorhabdaceae bacterium]
MKLTSKKYKGWYFSNIMPAIDKFMTLINKDYTYEFVDSSYCSILGKNRDEILKSTVSDVWGEENFNNSIKECLDKCFSGVPVVYDDWFDVPKLGQKYYKIYYIPYNNENGKVTHVISAIYDITEEKIEEEIFSKSHPNLLKRFQKKSLGVFICNSDGKFVYVNKAFVETTGFEREWLLNKSIFDLITPEERNKISYCVKSCLKGSHVDEFELSYIDTSGQKKWIKTDFVPIFQKGVVNEIIGVIEDITRYKLMENEIHDQRAHLESIICESPIPQFMINKDHKVVYWNKALENLRGITAKEMVGTKKHWKAFYDYERPCLADLVVDGVDIDVVNKWYPNKISIINSVGQYKALDFFKTFYPNGKWMYFSAIPVKDAKGNITGAVEILEDVTNSKLAEESIRLAEQKCMDILKIVEHDKKFL